MEESKKSNKRGYIKKMKEELESMLSDKDTSILNNDVEEFIKLYSRFIDDMDSKIEWDKINSPPGDKIINYNDLEEPNKEEKKKLINKISIIKLNGGLGTTMGLNGPKSAIQIRNEKNFLDLCVKQVEHMNNKYKTDVPLILMNSFNTDRTTQKLICKYECVKTFMQSAFPRISAETLMPIGEGYGKSALYPPGHGDLFYSLNKSGLLDELINEGKEILFISNIDNLAATVDFKIVDYMLNNNIDYLMEVTEKTRADIKGGTLIEHNDKLNLLEIAQVPCDKKSEFTSVRKFKIFNTNSIWINLIALKKVIQTTGMELDIIVNKKTLPGIKEKVIQLETAIGSAIKFFPNSAGVVVPRSRFLPVKSTSDLFLIKSNLYLEDHGSLKMNPKRPYPNNPLIKLLGKNFKHYDYFLENFKTIPDILELDHLTVSGNVKFGKNVTLKGTVIIIADENSVINIPDGSILDDKIVYGNLPILEH